MANTYTYSGPATRWSEGDPTAVDYLNVSRVNADHLYEALNTIITSASITSGSATALKNGTTATTQSASDNSTKLATTAYADAVGAAGVSLSGSTNNTVATVTGANALIGEANLTFDGSTLAVAGALSATGNISFDGGSFVFNEAGADKDFRIEGDSEANLFFADASTDRIGIGTDSPLVPLHLKNASSDLPVIFLENTNADANGPAVVFRKYGASPAVGDAAGEIEWQAYNNHISGTQSWSVAQIQAQTEYIVDGQERGQLLFKTQGEGVFAERMRIGSDNTVRMGASLQFNSTIASLDRYNGDADGYGWTVNYRGYNGGTSYFRDFLIANGKEATIVYVDGSAGAVGIGGTTAPESTLTVDGDLAVFRASNSSDRRFFVDEGTGQAIFSRDSGSVTPDGNVHIFSATAGTVSADIDADELVIENGNHAGISILTPYNKGGNIFFGDTGVGGSNVAGRLTYDHGTDSMIFACGAAERMRLVGGDLGIGTSGTDVWGSLHIQRDSSNAVNVEQHTNDANGPIYRLDKARGTIASPSGVLANDSLGKLEWTAWSTSGQRLTTAKIETFASQNWAVNDGGSYMRIQTQNPNADDQSTRINLSASGDIAVAQEASSTVQLYPGSTNNDNSSRISFTNTSSNNRDDFKHQFTSVVAEYATTIFYPTTAGSAGRRAYLLVVSGRRTDGSNRYFYDLVFFSGHNTYAVINSQSYGSPASRSYSINGTNGSLMVNLDSNGYHVRAMGFGPDPNQ